MNRIKEALAFPLKLARWSIENVFQPMIQGIMMTLTALFICLVAIFKLFKKYEK